ncbi:hypothetical protein [Ferruginibacter albus]|uniref:hypothetical protein n=1 Tax=Ferruginibacter albus TaxID=2875540 RepID=UPI001CC7C3E3|nr:hypothetical protein [Ferruginibacter albus]UAY52790.1 hypothetical protein K9M53_03690 [Ferruginibacter albus]
MKRILLYVVLIFWQYSCSPFIKLEGRYFSDRLDGIEIIPVEKRKIEIGRIDFQKAGLIIEANYIKQTRHKLKIRQIRHSGNLRPPYKKFVDKYDFRFIYTTDDSFMVSPISKQSKAYLDNRDSIVFKTKYLTPDRAIDLQKIIYHSGFCGNGYCDAYDMQVDKNGEVKVTVHHNRPNTSITTESFKGKMTVDDSDKLQRALRYAQLNILAWPPRMCCDLPMQTIIIYYNNQCLYLKAMYLPMVSEELDGVLGRIAAGYGNYKKVDEIFEFEE